MDYNVKVKIFAGVFSHVFFFTLFIIKSIYLPYFMLYD